MKISISKIALVLALGFVCISVSPAGENWDNIKSPFKPPAVGFDMDKFNRSIVFYQEGVRQYGASKFIGCNYLGLALQESQYVNDNYQTYNQMSPRYTALCYTGK